jgi:hypothetical protein
MKNNRVVPAGYQMTNSTLICEWQHEIGTRLVMLLDPFVVPGKMRRGSYVAGYQVNFSSWSAVVPAGVAGKHTQTPACVI